ncbi:hypothetical protein VHP8226_02838 [Vibrio hippocampi]|uniref:Uncharacterized protein n=1 Tax=Vibrio hippocampi TaxID=654686 RepID=A0ABN8DNA5_9VIBR|nr:hypothetical protein VHP8226_02838 [Vibrio hippocampi]
MTIDTFAVGVYFVFMIAVSLIFRRLVSSSTSNDSHWLHGIAFLWWCRSLSVVSLLLKSTKKTTVLNPQT